MPDQPADPTREGTGTLAALASLRQEPVRSELARLLADKSTGRSIIWATDAYAATAPGCGGRDQMTPDALLAAAFATLRDPWGLVCRVVVTEASVTRPHPKAGRGVHACVDGKPHGQRPGRGLVWSAGRV